MKKGQNKKTYKRAPKPSIGQLVRKTPGGRHGIYEASLNGKKFSVRKPLS